jgi:hypothetical protein
LEASKLRVSSISDVASTSKKQFDLPNCILSLSYDISFFIFN